MTDASQSGRTARMWCWVIPTGVFLLQPSHALAHGDDAAPPSKGHTSIEVPIPRFMATH